MPPVRWKLIAVTVIYLVHISSTARTPKDLTDNGWKPIIGHSSGLNFDDKTIKFHQSNQNDKVVTSSSRKPPSMDIQKPQTNTSPKSTVASNVKNINNQYVGHLHLNKVSPIVKQHYATGQGYNGQNIITHRSQTKLHKIPVTGKNYVAINMGGKRVVKPVRMQVGAYSQKDEVLAPAPSMGLGNYGFYSQSVKTRHPHHPNIDFLNHFSTQGNDLFQFQRLPVQQYILPKVPTQNDVQYAFQTQNDEYTRNLVPPPPSKQYIEKEKSKEKINLFQQEQLKPTTESSQVNKQRLEESQLLPETVLLQVPSPYQQTTYYLPSQNEQAVDVQVTKENIHEFHNNIPYRQESFGSVLQNYQFSKKPTETPRIPTYEVTEEKDWQEIPSSFRPHQFQQNVKSFEKNRHPAIKQQIENTDSFLPTPVRPVGATPTSPTQSEISTIFTELSHKINRQKENLDPTFFNIKEVSTHYPILGKPNIGQFNLQYSIPVQNIAEFPNEITTIKTKNHFNMNDFEILTETPTIIPTTTVIPTRDWQQKRRPNLKRRRPINRNKSTTEEIEQTTIKERKRRPIQRITEAPDFTEEPVKRNRQRQRVRPTTESTEEIIPYNHKMTSTEYIPKPLRGSYLYQVSSDSTRRQPSKHHSYANEDFHAEEEYSKPIPTRRNKPRKSNKYYLEEQPEENRYKSEENTEEPDEEIYENYTKKIPNNPLPEDFATIISTTDSLESITKAISEEVQEDKITIKEIYTTPETTEEETTLATTTASTPTTTATSTTTTSEPITKNIRTRRPIHYKPLRPKFSVKDYHQRLNQYISSTETFKTSTDSARSRSQYRTRRPILKQEENTNGNITENTRKKFIPKSQRQTETDVKGESTQASVKTINSRIRPFGRHRSTTEATTTQKVSIKPNIFNTVRRPPPISLRERIQSKYKLNTTDKTPKIEEESSTDIDADVTTSEAPSITITTEIYTTVKPSTISTTATKTTSEGIDVEDENLSSIDILKNDAILQSQRVSDLTSSTQNQYDTPGIFKSVSPNVRRIPNFFTIATDDPILPIEAFFPNINKERH